MTKQIFADNAPRLFENGYNILPVVPLTKAPAIKGWSNFCENAQSEFQVDNWCEQYPNYNIGIPLGSHNKLIAIDFDNDIGGMHKEIEKLLHGSPIKKKGQKGYTAFYKSNGERPKKWFKEGQAVVELLATGNQTVIPPSVHPETKQPYVWLTTDTLFDMPADELPMLPTDFVERVDKIFGYTERIIDFNKKYSGELPPLEEIQKALSFVPSGEYAMWITIGMSLNHNYGDAAYPIWDDWSRKAANYKDDGMSYKWQSFGKYGGSVVTIGTLLHYAIGYGYIKPQTDIQIDITPSFQITSSSEKKEAIAKDTPPPITHELPEHLLNAPGLPGQIAAWIDTVSIKKQPVLALGAAISAAGTIMAHRVRSESDLRTNFMVLGLAESGSGKERARQCIDSLFRAAGIDHLLLGDFASDVGLLESLAQNNAIGLSMIDEIGREIQSLNNSRAGHEAKILTTMMKMFSSASSIYRGKQYGNAKDRPRQDIVEPCLNIYGTTVPKRFFDALTSDEAIDGFLARWLVFASNDIQPEMTEGISCNNPPQQLIKEIEYIQAMPAYKEASPTMVQMQRTPNPKTIPFSQEARRLLAELSATCEKNRVTEICKGGLLAPIWSRTREHAIKLALVAHPYRGGIIESVTMDWACQMALYLTKVASKAILENISDTDHEKALKRIHGIIERYNERNNADIPHRTLSARTTFIKARERNEILTQLSESGMIQVREETNSNQQTSYFYKTN